MDTEQTLQRIVNAALAVFAAQGFHRAPIDDVARTAGIAKGTVYLYFKSKKALFIECLNELGRRFQQRLGSEVTGDGDALQQLYRVVELSLEFSMSRPEHRQIWLDAYRLSPDDPELKDYVDHYMTGTKAMLSALMQQGIEQGVLRPELAAVLDDVSINLMAWFDGLVIYWTYMPALLDVRRQADRMFAMLTPYMTGKGL